MRKIITVSLIFVLLILSGCGETNIEQATKEIEEPKQPEESTCTEMWKCTDENTKAFRKSDCTFDQETPCPEGCENGECKEAKVIEEPEEEAEPKEEIKESCTIGVKCLDDKRLGYRSSNCMFDNVEECEYGCKDGECIKTAPKKEEKEETFSLTQGKAIINKTGKKYYDFSEQQILQNEVDDNDLTVKLFAKQRGYDYVRVECPKINIWVIEKEITEATRSDCMEKISEANAYGYLRSAQTVCIRTMEKDIALVGGYWEVLPTEQTELSWKYYT